MSVWKLIQSEDSRYAIAICSFSHENSHTLSFKIGDKLELKEECQEWYRGCLLNNKQSGKYGIFPKSYVKIYDPKNLMHSDPSVYEIESILREWTSVWFRIYEECEKKKITHCLMGYFKNILNLKNVIVENRASIDEIKELKKSTITKILQGNSLLGLDVIAFDNNYNRLDTSETTTIFLYEELKKNSEYKNQALQPHLIPQASISSILSDDQLNDSNLTNFKHKSLNQNQQQTRVSPTYCLKLTIENMTSTSNFHLTEEQSELCVNLFMYKDNSPDCSYYLCENAHFKLSQIFQSFNRPALSGQCLLNTESTTSLQGIRQNKFALFCDISEKDFEMTKNGYKLFLIAYCVKNLKSNPLDKHACISRIFAGGIFDLGSNLCNLVYVSTDVRTIQSSMVLNANEFENSIVTQRILQDFINSKDTNDIYRSNKNSYKDQCLTLTFKSELSELSFKNVYDKYANMDVQICRKMDFPEIIMPDDFRNDFYITVLGGDFQKARNYEFVVNLVQFKDDTSGKLTEIPVDFNEEADNSNEEKTGMIKKKTFFYKSIAYSKQDKPKWNEVVNVSIPYSKKVEEIKKTYLRFVIRNRSLDGKDKTKIVGISYLQITNEDGSAIKDINRCFLPVTKLDNESEPANFEGYFFQFKNNSQLLKNIQKNTNIMFMNSEKLKDYIEVKVKVVSTQLTQNVTLLNLLSFPTDIKPDADKYESLLTYLDELLSVKEEQSAEIVKFLQAILDKLIDILLDIKTKYTKESIDDRAYEIHSKKIQNRVFEILVSIFQIIENQNKFASFRTVIDAYLSKNFCITLAHKPLLRIFLDLMNNVHDKYSSNNIASNLMMLSLNNSNSNITISSSTRYNHTNNHSSSNGQRLSVQSSNSNFTTNSSNQEDKENEYIINTIKSMEYIFKFAFRSRELYSMYNRTNNNKNNDSFDQDIESVFAKLTEIANIKNTGSTINSLNEFSTGSQINLTKIQSYILKYSITLLPILLQSKRYSMQKISEFYIGFLQSRFILQTQFLTKFIRTRLFETVESRRVIMEPLCRALNNLLFIDNVNEDKNRIYLKLEQVGKIFAELMDVLEKKNIGPISNDINEVCKTLLQLSNVFLYTKTQAELGKLYASIIMSIMRTMESSHYEIYFDWAATSTPSISQLAQTALLQNYSIIDESINKSIIRLKNIRNDDSISHLIIIKLIYTCKSLIDNETFPRDWFDLLILRNSIILNALYHIGERINKHHIENFGQSNKQIWTDYFECMVALVTDPCLQLENFNENKRKNILTKYKDLRVKASIEIKKMWYNLGDKKHLFIPNLVEPFMRVALIPINEIHNAIIPLFFDMINCEFTIKGNSTDFEKLLVPKQLITTLDTQVIFGNGDMRSRNAFEKILKEKFNAHMILRNNVDFVKKCVDLFDLLAEYRDLNKDSSDELKTFYLNEILTFYGNLKRYDLYVKYVEILRKIHKKSKNPVCAAYTLKLHAELLFWTNETIEDYLQHPSYPIQKSHKELKELLFLDLINDFTEGQAWEKAFELTKILRGIYESQYEFEKLYPFLKKQAQLCENIIKKSRLDCNYFLVGFYGKGFPRLLQNKKFVFRSEQLEQIMTFRPRVESWFPKAKRINHSNPPSEQEMNSDLQYIQVISVHPIYEQKEHFKNLNLSQQVLNYYHHNEVNKFKYSFRTNNKLNEDDPTLWWLKEKTVAISNQLPDVINFYPVIFEQTVDVSPVQSAINTVNDRLKKLTTVYANIQKSHEVDQSCKSLIQGTIDAGVLGGLPKYKKFLEASFLDENPDSAYKAEELKRLIIETINFGEMFLELCLQYSPNDDLLSILEREQLPKLKNMFEIPNKPTMRNTHQNSHQQLNHSLSSGDSSSKINSSKPSNILNELTSNKSFLKHLTQVDSGKGFFSYLVGSNDKSNQLNNSIAINDSKSRSNSHRDSVSSIKSINSEDDVTRQKIVLDETVNPKRPLRPSRMNTNNSTSSPSTSNQSSRPISHLSGDEIISTNSLQQLNSSNGLSTLSFKISDVLMMQEEDNLILKNDDTIKNTPMPPPKPPKPNTIIFNLKENNSFNDINEECSNSNGNKTLTLTRSAHTTPKKQTNGKLNLNQSLNDQNKSTISLTNKVQFRNNLQIKTNSDSILNRPQDNSTDI